ncbi:MAG: tRNA pseudouridine(38-40) synthase TruA [Flavobacteriaceae bacterium]|nr:tRNA pseudouridine(38-40) synthase TruA [Flavobacteriaceae bacterium]
MRYFIELSYRGKAYHGWQNQPNAISVQEVVEDALSKLLQTKIDVVGAGRTDAGVHAEQLFAHFDYEEPFDSEKLIFKLNSFLPKDISVQNLFKVKPDAHARFDALSRTYIYIISTKKDVFNSDGAFYLTHHLDIDKMNEAAKILFDYRDFKCFSRSHTDVKTYHCYIMLAEWKKVNNQLIFTIKADRFLRNMVRAIVGTMLDIGLGKTTIEEFHQIIKSEDRTKAGASVPAHGLYLSKIQYDNTIFI